MASDEADVRFDSWLVTTAAELRNIPQQTKSHQAGLHILFHSNLPFALDLSRSMVPQPPRTLRARRLMTFSRATAIPPISRTLPPQLIDNECVLLQLGPALGMTPPWGASVCVLGEILFLGRTLLTLRASPARPSTGMALSDDLAGMARPA